MVKTAHNQLIVDAYNANPTSMKLRSTTLIVFLLLTKCVSWARCVNWDSPRPKNIRKVAEQALQLGCEEVWLVGEEFQPYAEGARWFPDVEAVKTAITGGNQPVDRLILIKGSNGTKLFQLPALL
mgnify:CR=1 FL=1